MVRGHLVRFAASLLPILGMFLASPAPSLGEARGLSAGVATRLDWWVMKKREWSHWPRPEDWGADDIEEGFAGPGVMAGPRLSYGWRNLRLSGGLLVSRERPFDVTLHTDRVAPFLQPGRTHGRANRRFTALDLRYGTALGGILGFRRLDVTVSDWPSGQLRSHTVSDVVLGFSVEGQFRPNWSVSFEGALGVTGIRYAFDQEASVEHASGGDVSLDFGYAFPSAPVTLRFGYGVWVFVEPDGVYNLGFAGRQWEQFVNIAHGARLAASWAPAGNRTPVPATGR